MKSFARFFVASIAICLATLAYAEPPKGKTAPAPSPTPAASGEAAEGKSETFGDWVLKCRAVEGGQDCEISQTLIVQGQNNPIAMLAFGRRKAGDPLRLAVQVPNNVSFAAQPKASSPDGATIADLSYRRCLPSGCFADTVITDAQLASFTKLRAPAALKFRDGSDREISLPLSITGLAAAAAALPK